MGSSNGQINTLYLFILLFIGSLLLLLTTPHVEARRNLADLQGPHYENAMMMLRSPKTRFFGGRATISIWDPAVSRVNDSSSSSLMVLLTSDGTAFMEAGWIVYPHRYGDSKPRLFVYWTAGAGTGCYDLDCDGFQLFNKLSPLGQPVVPVSILGASSWSSLDIQIFQSPTTGNWQLNIEGVAIGSWPATLFEGIPDGATTIAWGGSVYDSVGGNAPHTDTDMGNGLFPDIETHFASSICSLKYVDASFTYREPELAMLGRSVTNALCYDAQLLPVLDTENGLCFLFGGSGRNPECL